MDTRIDHDRPPEPLRILSDLHLGHPASRVREAEQLRSLIEGARTVVFNGDTLEERKPSYRQTGDALRASLVRLCLEVGAQPVFLSGNHDPISPSLHHLDLYGGKVFVTHGDVFYPEVAPWSRNRREAAEIGRRVRADYTDRQMENLDLLLEINKRISRELIPRQPHGSPGFLSMVQTFWHEAWPPDRPFRILHTWANAPKVAHAFVASHRPAARLTLVGHTHRRFLSERDGHLVVNTGAFIAFARPYLVEIAGGTANVFGVAHQNGRLSRAPKPARTHHL